MRFTVAVAMLLCACGDAPPSPSSVTSARFLALLTNTPEVRPGGLAEVEALWVDPASRDVSFEGWWCWETPTVDPLRCVPSVAAGALAPGGTPRSFAAGPLVPPAGAQQVIVVLEARVGDERVSAFRRVGVRGEGVLHVPPELREVVVRQGARASSVVEGDTIRVDAESFVVEVRGIAAPGAEPLTASFFASRGAFDPPRVVSPAALASRMGAGAGSMDVWVVLRDSRGGVRARAFRVARGG
ncbi:MAG: hypothetical protein U0325_35250 [Polyangiales bacterium]